MCSDVRKAFAARAAGLNASVSGAGDSDMNADAAGPVAESSPVESSAAGVVSGLGASLFPVGYGYVALTAIGSVIMVAWKSMKVLDDSFQKDDEVYQKNKGRLMEPTYETSHYFCTFFTKIGGNCQG